MMETIIIITGLIMLLIATGYDLKWKYIPDYASYSFIIIALIARTLYAIQENNINLLINTLPAAGILGITGYLMYKTGIWGGGDLKIIIAIGILIASLSNETMPTPISYLANVMIVGAIYMLPAALITGLTVIKPTKKEKTQIILGLIIFGIVLTIKQTITNLLIAMSAVIIMSYTYLRKVENQGLVGPANMKTLMDGDWLVHEVKIGKKVIKPRKEGLTKEEAELIKNAWNKGKLKEKPVIKNGIPYLPALLFAYITTLTAGNLIIKLLMENI